MVEEEKEQAAEESENEGGTFFLLFSFFFFSLFHVFSPHSLFYYSAIIFNWEVIRH